MTTKARSWHKQRPPGKRRFAPAVASPPTPSPGSAATPALQRLKSAPWFLFQCSGSHHSNVNLSKIGEVIPSPRFHDLSLELKNMNSFSILCSCSPRPLTDPLHHVTNKCLRNCLLSAGGPGDGVAITSAPDINTHFPHKTENACASPATLSQSTSGCAAISQDRNPTPRY